MWRACTQWIEQLVRDPSYMHSTFEYLASDEFSFADCKRVCVWPRAQARLSDLNGGAVLGHAFLQTRI